MGDTKKVKHAGRFGSRYGRGVRNRVIEIEAKQRQFHECPACGFRKVKRISTGLYKCKKCGLKFAGGAYTPETMSGKIVKKMTKQRSFLPLARELIEAKEEKQKGLEEKKEEEKEKPAKKEGAAKGKKKPKKAAKKKKKGKAKEEKAEKKSEVKEEQVE